MEAAGERVSAVVAAGLVPALMLLVADAGVRLAGEGAALDARDEGDVLERVGAGAVVAVVVGLVAVSGFQVGISQLNHDDDEEALAAELMLLEQNKTPVNRETKKN